MKPTITVNQYPIGWEWLDKVPLEDFTWDYRRFLRRNERSVQN